MSKPGKRRSFIYAALCLAGTAGLWAVITGLEGGDIELILLLLCTVLITARFAFLVTGIVGLFKKDLHARRTYLIGVLIAMVRTAGYAWHDMVTDTGMFAGLMGGLILMFVIPSQSVLAIISLVLAIKDRKKRKARRLRTDADDGTSVSQ